MTTSSISTQEEELFGAMQCGGEEQNGHGCWRCAAAGEAHIQRGLPGMVR